EHRRQLGIVRPEVAMTLVDRLIGRQARRPVAEQAIADRVLDDERLADDRYAYPRADQAEGEFPVLEVRQGFVESLAGVEHVAPQQPGRRDESKAIAGARVPRALGPGRVAEQ